MYSDPGRDPRGHTISIAYRVSVDSGDAKAGDDAADLEFRADGRELALAFDHNVIVRDATSKPERE